MRNFLWKSADGDGGDHLVPWKMVVRAKIKGGLGIGLVKERNKALLFKWLWRFPLEQESLWTKVIKSKFGLHSNRWDAGLASRSTYRSPWKFISSLYDDFRHLVCFKVGDERRIRFWEDVWWDGKALANRFDDLYMLSLASNCTIAELIVSRTSSSSYGWDLQFFRNLHDRELENFTNLTIVLDQVHLNEELTDIRKWLPDNSGGFSSKTAFVTLQQEDGVQDFPFYKSIWKSGIPVRIKFFAWSLCLERIITYDVLQRKRTFQCLSHSWCIMCKQDRESISHLFLQCGYARSLWLKMFREFGLLMEIPDNILDLLKGYSVAQWNKSIKALYSVAQWNKSIKALWVCVVWAVLWGIWKERNSRIFSDEYVSVFNLRDKILFWVALWIKSRQDFRDIPLFDLSKGWSFLL